MAGAGRRGGSERLDDHQHDDGSKQQHRRFIEDAEPAFAALVGELFELAQQRTAGVVVADCRQHQYCRRRASY